MRLSMRFILVLVLAGCSLAAGPARAQSPLGFIGNGTGSGNGQLSGPEGIAIDTGNADNILVTDSGNNRIVVFSASGTFIRNIGSGPGMGDGQLFEPSGVAIDTANNSNVIVADYGTTTGSRSSIPRVISSAPSRFPAFRPASPSTPPITAISSSPCSGRTR